MTFGARIWTVARGALSRTRVPTAWALESSTWRAPGTGRSEKCTMPLASTHVQAGAALAAVPDNADNKISHLRMLQA